MEEAAVLAAAGAWQAACCPLIPATAPIRMAISSSAAAPAARVMDAEPRSAPGRVMAWPPYLYRALGSSARLAVVCRCADRSRARPGFLPAPDRCHFSAGLAGGSRGAKRSHGDAAGALDAVAWPAGRSVPGGGEAAVARRGI